MKTIIGVAMTLALLSATTPALADKFYKWVDENGTTHYDNTPPPEQVASEPVRTYDHQGSAQPAPRPSLEQDDIAGASGTASSTEGGTSAVAMSPELRQRCARLRKNLDVLSNRPIVRTKNPETGKMEVIDQQRRQKMLADARLGLEMCNHRRHGQ